MPAMRGCIQVSIFLAAGICVAQSAAAFGPEGHRLVGEIAEYHLCADARREIDLLLDGESLARAGSWPDWIRGRSEWAHTRPWHYINVDDAAPVPEGRAQDGAAGELPERGDVLWAIGYFDQRFADSTRAGEERAEALRFLAHFIADVHQPLHVGREKDRGGNAIGVRVDGRQTNLHSVWDAQALLKAARPAGRDGRQAQFRFVFGLTAGRLAALQAHAPATWARESMALRPVVYAFGPALGGADIDLEPAYLAGALEIIYQRLSEAGVRLAGRINRVYCAPAPNRSALEPLSR